MGCTGEVVAKSIKSEELNRMSLPLTRIVERRQPSVPEGLKTKSFRLRFHKMRRAQRFSSIQTKRCGEDTSVETLGKLKPAFQKDGTVTAGNAPSVNDGASAVVVTSLRRARVMGVEPMARIVAQATSGVERRLVMMAPVEAVRRVLKKTGWAGSEVDLIELNEAFSVAALAVTRELELDPNA